MAALRSRREHYIFALWFLLSFFFPRLISAVADWMAVMHGVALVRTRLVEIQEAKIDKNSPSGRHRTTLSGYILATKARVDNRKKTC